MKDHIKRLLEDKYFKVFLVVLIIGIFLRFYQIGSFATYLGDQGRDAIIMKRILTLEHLPAVGAPSSVGQVYLGPFYYYFMAPWMLISNFHPIGPAIGVAFLSSLFLLISYFIVKDIFDEKVALIAASLMAFSDVLIYLARFSWNPNLLPYFTLLSLYFLYKSLKTDNIRYFALGGIFLSLTMQLHYVSLALFPPIGIFLLWHLNKNKKKLKNALVNFGAYILGFIIFSLPLILFDLRHNFLNFKNFVSLFSSGDSVSESAGLGEIFVTFSQLNNFVFATEFNFVIQALLLFLIIGVFVSTFKKNAFLNLSIGFFLVTLIITSFFTENKFPHYFGSLYPFYFVLISYFLAKVLWGKNGAVLAFFFAAYLFLQTQQFNFLLGSGGNHIQRAENIAKVIEDNITVDRYRITGMPDSYGDSAPGYFLEIAGKTPIQKDTTERGDELFVICEDECYPLKTNQWSVTFFQPSTIVNTWNVENVTIHKLIR